MNLTGEQLDFAISQYVDGTLGELDRRALEERLLVDAELRLRVSEEARLTNLLRDTAGLDLPPINFDKLQAHLSSAIAAQPTPVAGPLPMTGRGWIRGLSIAAAVALVIGVGMRFVSAPEGGADAQPAGTAYVAGPSIEAAPAQAQVEIAVGPSRALAERGQTLSMADESVFAPSPRVVISAGSAPSQMALDLQPLY